MKKVSAVYFLFFLSANAVLCAAEDYSQWSAYKNIVLNTAAGGSNVSTNARNFPVLIRLTAADADVFADAQSNGADLRFTKADGVTRLAYQIERWDAVDQLAEVWVKVDTVLGGNSAQSIRMYWGNSGAADSSNGQAVFDTANGYAGVWHLNEASGNVDDATANADPGTNNGSAAVPGLIAYGRSFSAASNISLGNPTVLNFSGVITCEAWVYWLESDSTRNILDHGQAGGGAPEDYLRINNGVYEAGCWNGTNYNAHYSTAGDSAAWVQLAGVYDGSTWTLYRDGVPVSSQADSVGALIVPNRNWGIGATGDGGSRYFHGSIDEPRISKVARSADWIKLEFENQKPGQTLVTLGATVQTQTPPANLSYAVNPAVYPVGATITPDSAKVTGSVTHYSVTPTLPPGLALDTLTGTLSGTPAAATAAADYTVMARNAFGSTTAALNLTVLLNAPSHLAYAVDTADYPVGVGITPNTPTLTGSATDFTVTPSLPAGLVLDAASGVIWGTPASVSPPAAYTVTASNSVGSTQDTLSIAVTSATTLLPADGARILVLNIADGVSLRFRLPEAAVAIRLRIENMQGEILWTRTLPGEGNPGVSREKTVPEQPSLPAGIFLLRLSLENQAGKTLPSDQIRLFAVP